MDIGNGHNPDVPVPAPATKPGRLRSLQLQGYKTFAASTDFFFDGGITAIVGPNGSGKSNIADAIRWVLGEQSYRTLRGKRTEDMIFAGSAQRARHGMAAVSLVLDNADGWLPIDFAEVTVTRRAYRSGENEYLLNGNRVRLRDIHELLAKSGLAQRSYTVIGQGVVDAVLSLRPEDRRALFEEAAGISLYQDKRVEALARLDETRGNLVRVNDIINEIAPRLNRLEHEAERAERYTMLGQQLEGLLSTWYGYRWHEEQGSLERTRDALARREASVARWREALAALDEEALSVRAAQLALREQLGAWYGERSELQRQMEGVERDLAVWNERARLLAGRHDELQAEQVDFQAQLQTAAERVAAAEAEVADSQVALADREGQVAQAEAALETLEEQRAQLSRRLAEVRAQILLLATQSTDRRNRLSQLAERRVGLTAERNDHLAAIADHQAQAEEVREQLQAAAAEQARLEAELEALSGRARGVDAELAALQSHQFALRDALAKAHGSLEGLRGRHELISRLRAEGEGLYAGVRAVLQAATDPEFLPRSAQSAFPMPLMGIFGTVAQLLRVPPEYEVAIEVALGSHLQDVVVRTWGDAEMAIAFLQSEQRGRATFLPLDTVRAASRLVAPQEWGLVGNAADLVKADDQLAPVVGMLLGRTVVAQNLTAARRIFSRLRGGFQVVTLAGEVLRSSGSVTGGKERGQAAGAMLAREREWRELPVRMEATTAEAQRIEAGLREAQEEESALRQQSAALEAGRGEQQRARTAVEVRRLDLERQVDHLARQTVWRQEQITRLNATAQEVDSQQSSLQADLRRLQGDAGTADIQVATLQAELDGLRGDELYQRLSEARTLLAVAREVWEYRRTESNQALEAQAGLQAQLEARRQRLADLDEETTSLAAQIDAQATRRKVIEGWLVGLTERIGPAEAEAARLEAKRDALIDEETTRRARLRDAEGRHAQALLAYNRQEDRVQRLRQQIVDDFGLVEVQPIAGVPEQPPLPLGELVSSLPMVERLPEGLEEEIHSLKAQMRRMGAINPQAPEEYSEVLDRYSFLTGQATDLEEAAGDLRQVIAELDEVMRAEFQTTFQAVATRFKANFTRLFDGGTARLLLTEPNDLNQTGVDIVAQPPGRRQQTLALLSGGERALTAVALIFAFLQVSAPPFCLLDEVDAMLDEANVVRFRQALEELAQHTQFIVITHNRRTVEAANTIYGVSMGEDSVSQVVSLRLEGDRIAAPDGSTVDIVKE